MRENIKCVLIIQNLGEGIPKTIRIFDLKGKLFLQKENKAREVQTDIGELDSGIYIVKIISKRGIYTQKIVVL